MGLEAKPKSLQMQYDQGAHDFRVSRKTESLKYLRSTETQSNPSSKPSPNKSTAPKDRRGVIKAGPSQRNGAEGARDTCPECSPLRNVSQSSCELYK